MTATATFTSLDDAITQARAARAQGKLEDAAVIYKEMGQAYPGKKGSVIAADGLLECGHWGAAVSVLNAGLKQNPGSVLIMTQLARVYASVNDHARAATFLKQAVKTDPRAAQSWNLLAVTLAAARDWAGAADAYDKVLALDPLNFDAALGVGDALFQIGRPDEGIAAYRRAISLSPEHTLAIFKLGSALLQKEHLDEAESLLRRAIQKEPSHVNARINLATVFYRRGQLAQAIAGFREAATMDPASADAHFSLGVSLMDAGQIADAAAELREAAKLDPNSVMVLTALAAAERQVGNIAAAERALQCILPIEPNNIEAKHLLSALHGEPVAAPPPGYTEQLFDWFANRFDHHLVEVLGYHAPEQIAEMLVASGFTRGSLLDLGCGTGLMSAALREHAALGLKVGIDASANMLRVAREKKLYDELLRGDALQLMANLSETFELVTAADVLVYVGDLRDWMPAVARRLAAGGLFAYSIETIPEGKYRLLPTGRFAHTQAYLEELGARVGLRSINSREIPLRRESGRPVAGVIGILQKL